VIDHAEICRINADGTTTYHWENIEAAAQKWQPGCDDIADYLSKLLLPLRPSREWVGLTDEEIENMADQPLHRPQALHFARAIEAKLKGRNT
jgi:hypothetical protein